MAFIWFSIPAVLIAILALIMLVRYIISYGLGRYRSYRYHLLTFFHLPKSRPTQFDEFFKWAFLPRGILYPSIINLLL
jgi:hypothetical protein